MMELVQISVSYMKSIHQSTVFIPTSMPSKLSPKVDAWHAIMHSIVLPARVKARMIAVTTQYFTFWLPSWHTYSFIALLAKFQHSELLSWWPHPSPRKMEASKRTIWSFALKKEKSVLLLFSERQQKFFKLEDSLKSKVSMTNQYWSQEVYESAALSQL